MHGLLGAGEAEPCHLGLSQLLSGIAELSIEDFCPFIKGPTYDFFVTKRRNFQNSSLFSIGLTSGTIICHAFLWSLKRKNLNLDRLMIMFWMGFVGFLDIRSRRFFGLPEPLVFGHPDPLGRGPDPLSSSKINKKNIYFYCFVTST